jgi:NAD(P)-dependent dehydrogenase (short-subunit alcohol dehydrogenase family)
MNLNDKIALITGGTKGIGAATARLLAERGADVAVNGRHEDDDARQVRQQIRDLGRRCEFVQGDMGRPDDVARCVAEVGERLGPVDVLFHNAGALAPGKLMEVDPQVWHNAFNVHVHAVFYLVRAVVPMMRPKGEGAIVLMSSVAGIRGIPMHAPYQAVKGAIPQLVRAIAFELADDNIRVNAVAPGVIRTRFHAGMSDEQRQHNLDNRIPLHREGTPGQVASAVAELITNDYITGETLTVDGGLTMRIA